MRYYLKPSAERDLRKLPFGVQVKIIEKLRFYFASENPLYFARPLHDWELGEYRFRVGDYRVAFDLIGEDFIISTIQHRKDIYRQ